MQSASPFLSSHKINGLLRTFIGKFSHSFSCLSCSSRRRRKQLVDSKPALQYPHFTSWTNQTSDNPLEHSDNKIQSRHNVAKTSNEPDDIENRVKAVSHSQKRLVKTRRRLAHDQVMMQSEMGNVNSSLRFVLGSQDQFINAFMAIVAANPLLCQDYPDLIRLHDKLRVDHDKFRLHYSALAHSESIYTESSAELQQREEDFVAIVEKLLTSSLLLRGKTLQQLYANDDTDEHSDVEKMPQLLIDYHYWKGRLAILEEGVIDLEGDFRQELATHDFMEDHNQVLESSREELIHNYTIRRAQVLRELENAKAYFARLERKCRDEGLDMSEVRRPSSDHTGNVRDAIFDATSIVDSRLDPRPDMFIQLGHDNAIASRAMTPVTIPDVQASPDRHSPSQSGTDLRRVHEWFNGLSSSPEPEQRSSFANDSSIHCDPQAKYQMRKRLSGGMS